MWIPIVPDRYLSSELLLGCDVLGKDKLTWDNKGQTLIWQNEFYPISFLQKRGQVEKVTVIPCKSKTINQLWVEQKVNLMPYQRKLIPINVKENLGTTVTIHPEKNTKCLPSPFCNTVNEQQQI